VQGFAGIKVCGIECDVDARYVQLPYEIVKLGEGHVVHIRNSGLFAIRIAALTGAAEIVLVGFATQVYEALHGFRGLTEGLAALIAELQGQGVTVRQIEGV